ncbi:hypothetical protein MKW98_025178 [Papaver atlanticum]|uniref:Uncharacterized protein n=1 Tax=Papaver atlanticum TaxID=357466 RepID=A0AAD4S1K8_9MAGN|nr:hypothetical protein MKW98_025178 [Papaver atlanticum]
MVSLTFELGITSHQLSEIRHLSVKLPMQPRFTPINKVPMGVTGSLDVYKSLVVKEIRTGKKKILILSVVADLRGIIDFKENRF